MFFLLGFKVLNDRLVLVLCYELESFVLDFNSLEGFNIVGMNHRTERTNTVI
jgi:hypothetical protein